MAQLIVTTTHHMKKMNSLLQLCGRAHGHKKYVNTMKVIMPKEVWIAVKSLVENLLELKKNINFVFHYLMKTIML